jgi:hypothetical protein
MWLKKSITFDIFRITNKYTLFTFNNQQIYTEENYIWFNFSPLFLDLIP